uniref:ABC transporter permease n=1 Tax=Thermosporothrix sp. COM3 TaxID=2490863 RepID=A0A455SBU0_9CHLR|nr:ABC transporter permease [Thermosporothrix sp. COM3]
MGMASIMAKQKEQRKHRAKAEGSLWHKIRSNPWSYVYVAPMFILLMVFSVYPIIASIIYTFYRWNGIGDPSDFVGLENFQKVITDPLFWQAFRNTFIYMLVLVPIQLTIALALALVLNNPKLRFSTVYRALFFIPAVTSPAIIGVVMQLLVSNGGGMFSQWLVEHHITKEPIDWLGDPHFALWIVIIVGIWNTLGYNLVYFLAGLQTIPTELYEAARIDGANSVNRFLYVTVPQLRSVGLVILFMAILGSLQVFDMVQVLTGGGPFYATEVVSTYIYRLAFGGGLSVGMSVQPNVGFASAASFFYGVILMGLTLIQMASIGSIAKKREAARQEA